MVPGAGTWLTFYNNPAEDFCKVCVMLHASLSGLVIFQRIEEFLAGSTILPPPLLSEEFCNLFCFSLPLSPFQQKLSSAYPQRL